MTVRVPRLPFSLDPLIAEAKRRARQRRLLIAIAVVLFAGLAAGLTLALRSGGGGPGGGHPGAFKAISGAQHAQTGANVLPPSILAALERSNADTQRTNARPAKLRSVQFPLLLLDSARFLGKIPGGSVYALTNTRGDFCRVDAIDAPHGGPPGFDETCSPPLDRSQPIQMEASNYGGATETAVLHVGGVAMDGVTSVSFTVSGKAVTVPVKNNVFGLNRHTVPAKNSVFGLPRQSRPPSLNCPVAHFSDGSIVNAPGYPCRSGRRTGDTSQSG